MYLSTLGVFASLLALGYADCTHNNCLRAVIGLSYPSRSGLADCMSYLQATVTPATSTLTVTQTAIITTPTTSTETDSASTSVPVTITETHSVVGATVTATYTITRFSGGVKRDLRAIEERQATVVPTNIPAYALAPCSSLTASYAYACSCVGATPSTITVAAPSTTVTVTATSTAASLEIDTIMETKTDTYTTTATTVQTLTTTKIVYQETTVCSPKPSSFYLRASNGNYLRYAANSPATPTQYGKFYPDASIGGDATVFAIDAAGNVYIPGSTGPYGGLIFFAGGGANGEPTLVFGFDENEIPETSGEAKMPCELNSSTNQLTCSFGSDDIFVLNNGFLLLVGPGQGGTTVTLFADCS